MLILIQVSTILFLVPYCLCTNTYLSGKTVPSDWSTTNGDYVYRIVVRANMNEIVHHSISKSLSIRLKSVHGNQTNWIPLTIIYDRSDVGKNLYEYYLAIQDIGEIKSIYIHGHSTNLGYLTLVCIYSNRNSKVLIGCADITCRCSKKEFHLIPQH
ncbi:unnamed protein product [Didymodactylos carnosus]|uniref:Uncharacterized protein n=1 Tax=Didymodactylos carnosus TaxID=1234261 RepID=A0A814EQI1_9BILA|nr:unnamed protein product [Didymodactylos carnosus]CAF3742490.1 unnamed protein product [Didymodactylos carnosus]